jgi:hypothetical protein
VDRTLENYYSFKEKEENTAFLMKKILKPEGFWIFDLFKRIKEFLFFLK